MQLGYHPHPPFCSQPVSSYSMPGRPRPKEGSGKSKNKKQEGNSKNSDFGELWFLTKTVKHRSINFFQNFHEIFASKKLF